ncbi:MAG: hypothetical protein QM529_01045 [Hydrotalea sp.]|nr:hypothetical protein [Hydrotalea sp.]
MNPITCIPLLKNGRSTRATLARLCLAAAIILAPTFSARAQNANDSLAIPDNMRVPKTMTSSFALPADSNKLGLFLKGGFAAIIPFDETGFAATGDRVTNTFKTAFAPTMALGYDFNKDYSAEANFLFYKTPSSVYFSTSAPLNQTSTTISNYILTIDQSFHGVSIWQFSFPLRLGVGALFWNNPSAPAASGTFFLLKLGTGLKFNIVQNLSIFSTMDVETRFDYYFAFGDRRNTNVAQGSQLLLSKDIASGGIGSVMVDFKLGF